MNIKQLLLALLRLLSNKQTGEQTQTEIKQVFRVEKFDGDPPKPGELKEPAEIVEGGDDIDTVVTYRAGEGAVKKLYTGDPQTGHAVLAEEKTR